MTVSKGSSLKIKVPMMMMSTTTTTRANQLVGEAVPLLPMIQFNFMFLNHICFRTREAPRRNCAAPCWRSSVVVGGGGGVVVGGWENSGEGG